MWRILAWVYFLKKVNITKTLYFNFKMLPFHQAKKLPFYFYGPVVFPNLSGNINIQTKALKRGMIQFGCKEENIISTFEPTRIYIQGSLTFTGTFKFGSAIQFLVWDNGQVELGDNGWIGSFTKLVCFRSIKIKNNLLASWECQIFDTDFHFIENVNNGQVSDASGSIVIGHDVWLGNRVSIAKNTVIADECIVASGSLCNKDYTSFGKNTVIGGTPAKYIKSGVKYMADKRLERRLFKHFSNPQHYGAAIEIAKFKN
jgi:acetyltransferase-like isoleucine patch superfamily enzyme